jgi:uncharacterized membrane protein
MLGRSRLQREIAKADSAHSKYGRLGRKPALDILDERYAKGDINREEYRRLKVEIAGT